MSNFRDIRNSSDSTNENKILNQRISGATRERAIQIKAAQRRKILSRQTKSSGYDGDIIQQAQSKLSNVLQRMSLMTRQDIPSRTLEYVLESSPAQYLTDACIEVINQCDNFTNILP